MHIKFLLQSASGTKKCANKRFCSRLALPDKLPLFQSRVSMFVPRARLQYNLQDMATAFDEVLASGETVAKVARKYRVPRKTLENYVSGRTNIETLYKKLGEQHKYMGHERRGGGGGGAGIWRREGGGEVVYQHQKELNWTSEDVEVL